MGIEKLYYLLMPWRRPPPAPAVSDSFRTRYSRFKTLLHANTELSRIIGDIEEKQLGHQLFGMTYVRAQAARALHQTRIMIDCLNDISHSKYPALHPALQAIESQLRQEIGEKKELPEVGWVVPLSRISRALVDQVGSKNANLGEVMNQAGLPVPNGFAVTVKACEYFLKSNQLPEFIRETVEQELTDAEEIKAASDEIRRRIIEAPVPPDLEQAILDAYDTLVAEVRTQQPDYKGEISVRSSAVGEDTELSHAGQYLTVLNVSRDKVIRAWVNVIASLFSPWAITYRLNKGFHDEALSMGVACLQMLDPVASGVAFSRHPFNRGLDVAVLSAVWGLGPYAVDGTVTPDLYHVSRQVPHRVLELTVARKEVKLIGTPDGELREAVVPEAEQSVACLSEAQAQQLAGYALQLDSLYGSAQDIEWAIDRVGRLFVLQSRPLRVELASGEAVTAEASGSEQYPVLIRGGAAAYPGVGGGPVFRVSNDDELRAFPDGAVLVAKHPSPRYVLAMKRAAAIVTDTGSPLGHMASLCREFRVPTLLDTRAAFSTLENGRLVTVDSQTGRIYDGLIEELLQKKENETNYMEGTAEAKALDTVARWIVPLSLTNPRSAQFTPTNCRSLHDIMRFVHESSYAAMFRISDLLSQSEGATVKLIAQVPLDLYLIDLGGGLKASAAGRKSVRDDAVVSVPFKALLGGMLHPDLRFHQPRPINVSGFFSVMSEQMLTPPDAGGERFGDRSYAIISDHYLHFSSRIGYHYSILDSWCDENARKNHITFSFQGGAANEVRRARRARAIAEILRNHSFSVDTKADRVEARLKRVPIEVQLERLDMLGRLLQFTRQLDMLMESEASVKLVAKAFLEGRYHF